MKLTRDLILTILGSAIGFPGTAFAGPIDDCLATTGLAYQTSASSLLAGTGFTWIFGGPSAVVSCDPPDAGTAELAAGGSAAAASFAGGVGGFLSTGALAPPFAGASSTGLVNLALLYSFDLVPDDPLSTDPVTIEIVTRHQYDVAEVSASGTGVAANLQLSYYELRNLANGGYIGPTWTNNAPVVNGSFIDIHHTVEVPVNTSVYLRAEISQRSDGNPGGSGGSAAATLSAKWTFEVTTQDAATVHFDLEDLLALDPPQLGVVPEPELGAALVPLAAIAGGVATRARRRRRQPA